MTVAMKDNVSEGNKEVTVSKTVTTWIIWLPDRSAGQCGIVRAILLPRFGQSVLKWGGGGVKSHTWTFLGNHLTGG